MDGCKTLAMGLMACVLGNGSLGAQVHSKVDAAPLVRLTQFQSWKPLIGVPVSMTANTTRIVLVGRSDTVTVAMASLRKVERLTGRRGFLRRGRTGAIIGASVLGVLGLAGGAAQNSDAVSTPAGLLAGVAAGGLIGGLMGGALSDGNVWG